MTTQKKVLEKLTGIISKYVPTSPVWNFFTGTKKRAARWVGNLDNDELVKKALECFKSMKSKDPDDTVDGRLEKFSKYLDEKNHSVDAKRKEQLKQLKGDTRWLMTRRLGYNPETSLLGAQLRAAAAFYCELPAVPEVAPAAEGTSGTGPSAVTALYDKFAACVNAMEHMAARLCKSITTCKKGTFIGAFQKIVNRLKGLKEKGEETNSVPDASGSSSSSADILTAPDSGQPKKPNTIKSLRNRVMQMKENVEAQNRFMSSLSDKSTPTRRVRAFLETLWSFTADTAEQAGVLQAKEMATEEAAESGKLTLHQLLRASEDGLVKHKEALERLCKSFLPKDAIRLDVQEKESLGKSDLRGPFTEQIFKSDWWKTKFGKCPKTADLRKQIGTVGEFSPTDYWENLYMFDNCTSSSSMISVLFDHVCSRNIWIGGTLETVNLPPDIGGTVDKKALSLFAYLTKPMPSPHMDLSVDRSNVFRALPALGGDNTPYSYLYVLVRLMETILQFHVKALLDDLVEGTLPDPQQLQTNLRLYLTDAFIICREINRVIHEEPFSIDSRFQNWWDGLTENPDMACLKLFVESSAEIGEDGSLPPYAVKNFYELSTIWGVTLQGRKRLLKSAFRGEKESPRTSHDSDNDSDGGGADAVERTPHPDGRATSRILPPKSPDVLRAERKCTVRFNIPQDDGAGGGAVRRRLDFGNGGAAAALPDDGAGAGRAALPDDGAGRAAPPRAR